MSTGTINQKAIDLLDQAAFTSSAVKDKERQSGSVKDEHLYPKTKDEALKMKDLLAQAWDAAEDREEAEFKEKYERLSEVVEWSLTKHKTWKWPVIAGAALFAALLFWGYAAQLKDVKKIKTEIAQVKAWEAVKDTVITWEECGTEYSGTDYYKDATTWKTNRLALLKSTYERYSETAAEYKAKADTASNRKDRKAYKDYEKKYTKDAAEKRKEFDDLSDAKFKSVQKQAVKSLKGYLSDGRGFANFILFFVLLVVALIGLYIWTGNPYGYNITKSRTRHKILGWIQKVGFWFAGICFGGGVAAQLFADDIVWKYSDGSTSRESDVAGTAMNVMWKIFLIVIGVAVFIGVAGLIMLLEVAFALPAKIEEDKQDKLEQAA